MLNSFEWNHVVIFLKDLALIFSVGASGYSLYSIFQNHPKIDVNILDIKREQNYLAVKLSFQNRGKQMSSATKYVLKLEEKTFNGLQKLEQKIYPTGHHSISRSSPKYIEAYPLELPQGKACHFNLLFDIKSEIGTEGKLCIDLINHKNKVIDINIPTLSH